ncbi:MAG: hypothetical protein K2O11_08545 [Oscillospiraceae bacterium]|nr:hypothetical protein [Oscillospiraceae bacterium]
MGKKILDSKILYMVLSIIISLSLWIWVTSRDENKDSQRFTIPITFEGVDILEDRGLMIVNENVTASITVRAAPMILATLNNNPPQLVANVSSISAEGTHRVVYSTRLPSGSGVNDNDVEYISGASGTAVNVEVARSLRREGIEIRGEWQGSTAEGYLAGDKDDFRFDPGTLTISGRAELVNQVAYAKVIVTGEDLTESVGDYFPFQLIGASGDPLDLDISCDVDTIYTSFPIRATAEIPLEVKVTPGGGLGVDDVSVKLDTDSIVVAGSREAVDGLVNLGAITVASIDLATLEDDVAENGGERTYSIPLTDELENVSGVTEVTVTLKIRKRVETREFEVKADRISTTSAPEGWQPSIITQVLKVKIRGTAALLDELTEENIWAVANLQEINAATGQHTVSASVYLNSAGSEGDVGVVNPASYTVVVSLAQDG